MRFTPICFALFIVLLLFSCIKNEQDQDAPSLTLKGDNDGQTVTSGELVSFQVNCADDIGLAMVRVEADCPLSGWNAAADPSRAVQEFQTIGETLELSSAFALIEDLHTETCSLTITCIDKEGNESNSDSFSFDVRNAFDSSGPIIALLDSIEVGEDMEKTEGHMVGSGLSFSINGTAQDDSNVENVLLEIFSNASSESTDQREYIGQMEIDFSEISLLAPATAGKYSLRIGATDGLNNYRERIFPLIVTE